MKVTPRSAIALVTFTVGVLAAIGWSARIGRKVWSPRVFAWRNFFKPPPLIEEQANCPVRLVRPRFYSFASIGSSVGSVLKLDVENVSNKPVHSFTVSYRSPEPTGTGSGGWQPETLLLPGQSHTISGNSNGRDRVTFSVDYVQFADGDVWYADPPRATVKPEGVRAGAQAASDHLREVLASSGASAVMDALPRIHVDVQESVFSMRERYGYFGFYQGVNHVVVRVQYAYRRGGLPSVEALLRRQSTEGRT